MHDLIVIGGGASGLAAAAYALDKHLDVLVIYESLGGKYSQQFSVRAEENVLVGHIMVHLDLPAERKEPHMGQEAILQLQHQVTSHTGTALRDRVTAVRRVGDALEVHTEQYGVQRAAAVLIATGVTPRPLGVPGAEQYILHGLAYSPITYANMVADRTAAVVGTTARALRGAVELSRRAAQVYLVEPGALPAADPLAAVLRSSPNVEILEGYVVTAVSGMEAIETVTVQQGDRVRRLSVDALFVDLGLAPNSAAVRSLVAVDEEGFIKVDSHNATSVPGVFAAGDVTTVYGEHALIAMGEGVRAALSAHDYLLARPGRRGE
jgi:thioredoxin reductase